MGAFDRNYKKVLEKVYMTGYKYEDPNRKGVKRIELKE
jgi:hypothetical protein